MTHLDLAKRRAARRHDQGGAVMFIVAMTIAVLASVGVYALAAASTEVRMSGNERQNSQTHYLAEYGILGAAQAMSAGLQDFYLGLLSVKSSAPQALCVSLANEPTTATKQDMLCQHIEENDFAKFWNTAGVVDSYAGSVPYAPKVDPGSFGTTPMQGDFYVELTEPQDVGVKLSSGGTCGEMLTATSFGRTRALYPTVANSDTSQYGGMGVEVQRAQLIVYRSCSKQN
jgi:Tfp pilus assembly protein PilX